PASWALRGSQGPVNEREQVQGPVKGRPQVSEPLWVRGRPLGHEKVVAQAPEQVPEPPRVEVQAPREEPLDPSRRRRAGACRTRVRRPLRRGPTGSPIERAPSLRP